MDPKNALRDGFSRWLEEVVAAGNKIKPGRLLDPFATSMRNSARAVPWMDNISHGSPPTVGDSVQAVTDLRGTGMVEGKLPDVSLTQLGERVWSRWSGLAIANVFELDEIARCAVIVNEGLRLQVSKYQDAYHFWCELVAIREAEYWLSDVHMMYMPSYLDQTDSHGYNPFRVLIAISKGIGDAAEWESWASEGSLDGGRVARLTEKIRTYRPGGRRAFCRAMELYRLARKEPQFLPNAMKTWGIPE